MKEQTVNLYCPNGHTWMARGLIDESGFTGPADCPECGEEAETHDG